MIECVRQTSRNVKRWSSGEMALRWTAAGMLEAERQFRRVIGYRDLAKLAVEIEHNLAENGLPDPSRRDPHHRLSSRPKPRRETREGRCETGPLDRLN
jgi:hypothetical protein